MRITDKQLQARLEVINDMLNRPNTYAKGAIVIEGAYGGVSLSEVISDGGAERTISGRMTKRELYEYMEGFIKGIQYQRGDYKNNPHKKKITRKTRTTPARTRSAKTSAAMHKRIKKSSLKNKYSIWKVVNGKTTGLATSNVFTTKAGAKTFCENNLDKRGSYAIVNSRLTSVGVNKALAGKV